MSATIVWTVGHSNLGFDEFVDLVTAERIDYLVDVRSFPYSRFAPHFNRDALQREISGRGIEYVFVGKALGGRPARDEHYDADGHAMYGPMAEQPEFQTAIDKLLYGARRHRLALMCSCGEPLECHRRLLVGKVLCERGAELRHILRDGSVQVERSVAVGSARDRLSLFEDDESSWRSTQSVSHRRRLSTSSSG